MPRFKAQHCTFSNSSVDNFLGILQKSQINYFSKTSLDGYFKLKSDISLKSVPQHGWKVMRPHHEAKQWKIYIYFCIISTTLTKTEGGGEDCFILQENFVSKFLEN